MPDSLSTIPVRLSQKFHVAFPCVHVCLHLWGIPMGRSEQHSKVHPSLLCASISVTGLEAAIFQRCLACLYSKCIDILSCHQIYYLAACVHSACEFSSMCAGGCCCSLLPGQLLATPLVLSTHTSSPSTHSSCLHIPGDELRIMRPWHLFICYVVEALNYSSGHPL